MSNIGTTNMFNGQVAYAYLLVAGYSSLVAWTLFRDRPAVARYAVIAIAVLAPAVAFVVVSAAPFACDFSVTELVGLLVLFSAVERLIPNEGLYRWIRLACVACSIALISKNLGTAGSVLPMLFSTTVFTLMLEQILIRPTRALSSNENMRNVSANVLRRLLGPYLVLQLAGASPYGPQLSDRGCPFAVQAGLALVVLDLKMYWWHRLQHSTALWRFHKLHHATIDLSALSSGRTNVLEYFVCQEGLNVLIVWYLGLAPEAVAIGYIFTKSFLNGSLMHSSLNYPVGARMPWHSYVINSPKAHAQHHALIRSESAATSNYGEALMIWDWLFGTLEMPEAPPARCGIDDTHFTDASVLKQTFVLPFFRTPSNGA